MELVPNVAYEKGLVPDIQYVLSNPQKQYYALYVNKKTSMTDLVKLPKLINIRETNTLDGNKTAKYEGENNKSYGLMNEQYTAKTKSKVEVFDDRKYYDPDISAYLYTDLPVTGGKRKTRRRKQSKRKISRRR